jgi:hypothetical protein
MSSIEIQFTNSARNPAELLCNLFDSNGWSLGMRRRVSGGAEVVLQDVPLEKAADIKSVITIMLEFGSAVSSGIVGNWLWNKISTHGQSEIMVDRTEIVTTTDGLSKIIQTIVKIKET